MTGTRTGNTQASLTAKRIADFIAAFNLGLRDDHLLEADATGRVTARYFHSRLSSMFQPIRDVARRGTVGHEGLIRCHGEGLDAPTSPWGIFALAGLERDLVELDRLCRTLHMLNYFRQAAADSMLFLNVDLRLLIAVRQGFGRAFEERLERVGLKPRNIVIELPSGAISRHELLERAASDYRERGYRIAVACQGPVREWRVALTRARPDYVKISVNGTADESVLRSAVKAAHDGGAAALAERVETSDQEERSIAAGFDFLQGFHLGQPAWDVERPIKTCGACTGRPVQPAVGEPVRERRAEPAGGKPPVLVVPGLYGSGAGHWQTLWEAAKPEYVRVVQDDWAQPDLDSWAERLDQAIWARGGNAILVAHSFGSLAVARRALLHSRGIAGALLVAPANPDKFDVTWMLPTKPLPFPVTVVGSENDPWMPLMCAEWWANRWGARFVNAGAAGHVNADSGHGAWPEGANLLEELVQLAMPLADRERLLRTGSAGDSSSGRARQAPIERFNIPMGFAV